MTEWSNDELIPAQAHHVYSQWGRQLDEEMVVVRTTAVSGGYRTADSLPSDYAWHLVGWILSTSKS